MSDDNPYQPPTATPTELQLPPGSPEFAIGWWGIFGLAVVAGLIVGALIALSLNDTHPFFVLGFPFVGWFVAITLLMVSLTPTKIGIGHKTLLAAGLSIPAYVIYVPICTIAGAFSQPIFGSADGYAPSPAGLIFASVITFILVLFAVAASIRARLRSKALKYRADLRDDES